MKNSRKVARSLPGVPEKSQKTNDRNPLRSRGSGPALSRKREAITARLPGLDVPRIPGDIKDRYSRNMWSNFTKNSTKSSKITGFPDSAYKFTPGRPSAGAAPCAILPDPVIPISISVSLPKAQNASRSPSYLGGSGETRQQNTLRKKTVALPYKTTRICTLYL